MERKKLIIIGASSGIGRELACKYATSGWMVGVTGRRESLLKELEEKFPGQVILSCFDVTGPDNRSRLDALIAALGGLDLLIYNSGYGDTSADLDPEIEERTTRTNVNGFVELTGLAFRYFVSRGQGQIALTSSVAGLRGNSWAPAYSASKAFMSRYAEGLNIKAARLNKDIVITDIRPGFVDTNLSKGPGRFWVAPAEKAARQIIKAIEKKKRVAYITRRWWLVAMVMKCLPFSLYRRLA